MPEIVPAHETLANEALDSSQSKETSRQDTKTPSLCRMLFDNTMLHGIGFGVGYAFEKVFVEHILNAPPAVQSLFIKSTACATAATLALSSLIIVLDERAERKHKAASERANKARDAGRAISS